MVKYDDYYSTYVQQWETLLKDFNVNNSCNYRSSNKDTRITQNINNRNINNNKNSYEINYVEEWNNLLKDYNANNSYNYKNSNRNNTNRNAHTTKNTNNRHINNTKNNCEINYVEEWNNLLNDYKVNKSNSYNYNNYYN